MKRTNSKGQRTEDIIHPEEDIPREQFFKSVPLMKLRVDGTSHATSLLSSAEHKVREQLLIASEKGKKHAVYLLLHQGVQQSRCRGMRGFSPLHHAATRGHLEVLQLLLNFGWGANIRNDFQETPLHLACYNGHTAIVEFLLDKGGDINALTSDGETPLFYAARKNHYRIVRILIRRECNLAVRNRFGDVAEDEATTEKTQVEFDVGKEDASRLYHGSGATSGEHAITQKLREQVLAYLDLKSLCRVAQVCYRWHRASDSPSLWRNLGISRWELSLQTTVGIGAISQMSMMSLGSSLQLNLTSTSGGSGTRRPSSCDQVSSRVLFESKSARRASGGHAGIILGVGRRPQTARTLAI
ncbi:hypothetical protein Poli38472_001461 [Pythium oligandrum]|uniref:F-box domain-containing protein n=1 Tax=Pythium oligandrum TaxID=41045 RepID=A0A8K1CV83_PYTOL|nr:hypothetical protein Poli38472_001461 [Pythium oligandrum]|eukprot:TMW69305.1 hypothetical protein Poli38472_001461 [Pythium oligandrum]